jgi:hypothetical protein
VSIAVYTTYPKTWRKKMRKPRFMYKIHCFTVADGMSKSAGNNTFYETYEEAVDAARSYCADGYSNDDYVIYKAVARVKATYPPVEVTRID